MGLPPSPKVSVNMPCYNGARYLRSAIDSILSQSLSDFELLIVDDGSTDESVEIVASYSDPRIRLLKNGRNQGIVATRNRALQESRGEYVAILDCDDEALPQRLERQCAFLDEHPQFAMAGSWMDVVDENGQVVDRFQPDLDPERVGAGLLFMNWFAQSTVMLRRSMIPPEGYSAEYPTAEDYELWARIAARHPVTNLRQTLVRYRRHAQSTSNSDPDSLNMNALRVQTDQLRSMGLDPSGSEASTHWAIATGQGVPLTMDTLKASEAWLIRILQANADSGRYDHTILTEFVTNYWYAVCQRYAVLGSEAHSACSDSSLSAIRHDHAQSTKLEVARQLSGSSVGRAALRVGRAALRLLRSARAALRAR